MSRPQSLYHRTTKNSFEIPPFIQIPTLKMKNPAIMMIARGAKPPLPAAKVTVTSTPLNITRKRRRENLRKPSRLRQQINLLVLRGNFL
jgi:hypothetical protein